MQVLERWMESAAGLRQGGQREGLARDRGALQKGIVGDNGERRNAVGKGIGKIGEYYCRTIWR